MILFKVFTLFPELFPGPLNCSITKKALEKNLWDIEAINIRDYATDLRKTVDDSPYGGGAGMVLKPDIIANAIEANLNEFSNKSSVIDNLIYNSGDIKNNHQTGLYDKSTIYSDSKQNLIQIDKPLISNLKTKIVYLSPRGRLFNQQIAREFAQEKQIAVLCGRYEGIDQRVIDYFKIEEISIGNYVLSGGEIAAYVFIDAILRNVKEVLGAEESLFEESFGSNNSNCEYQNLLEYPHYTKPSEWRGMKVPEILLSGHHKKISDWRKQKAIEITNIVKALNKIY